LMGKFTSEDMSNTIAQILAVKEDNEMSKWILVLLSY
jgi:hypothetical protein